MGPHLTHLYLQRNKITKIENINGLRKLKKLYLGHNCIAVVEGLDKLCNLEELHIQNQQFPQGESLHFDPRTVKGLSRCLHILDVTDNGMTSIADLECLYEIRSFIAQNNQLANISDITQTVSKWHQLTNLELQENPVCSQQKYKERIITSSNSLILLNGKMINDTTRNFLIKLEVSKQGRLMAPHHIDSTPKLPVEITDLTKNFTPGVRKSITRSILKDAELRAVLENSNKTSPNFMFPAWKACLEAESYPRPGTLVPRPFWRQVNGGQAPQSRAKKSVENLHLPRL